MAGRALILGSNGFVGGWLAKELADHGWEPVGSDLGDAPSHSGLAGYRSCSLLDADGVARLVADVRPDAVVNLAAVSSVGQSWRNPHLTMEVNVVGTVSVLEAVRAQDPMPRVLLIGSSEQYAPKDGPLSEDDPVDANNPYGISKATQERMARLYREEYGLSVCLTRSFNHTGPGQAPAFVLPSWCRQVADIELSGKPGTLRVGNLHVARDFTDVRDVVRAYRLILESGYVGEPLNVGSGLAHELGELAQTIVSFASVPVNIEQDPALVRDVDNPLIVCNPGRMHKLTGWKLEHDLKDTLREMYEGFLAQ